MQPPIPNPESGAPTEPGTRINSDLCPRCGASIAETNSPYCPACGVLLEREPKIVAGIKILLAICLILLVLPLGAAGACFLLFSGAFGRFGGEFGSGFNWGMVGIALGLLLAALLCLWGFVALIIKK